MPTLPFLRDGAGDAVVCDAFERLGVSLNAAEGVQWLLEELPRLTVLVGQVVEDRRAALAAALAVVAVGDGQDE